MLFPKSRDQNASFTCIMLYINSSSVEWHIWSFQSATKYDEYLRVKFSSHHARLKCQPTLLACQSLSILQQ
uniref:Uncharacterized protein n=1 Tax=Arundo donax TaxID=35708 RepID=A0A0A9CHC3_ARUDO